MSQNTICVPRVSADRFQIAVTFSTRALIFDPSKSSAAGDSIRASRASFRPSVVMARALSSRGSTFVLRMRSYRATSSSCSRCCSSDIGQASVIGLPPTSFGRGKFSISAVCTSANCRNICWSSGRFTNLANRDRGLSDLPSRADLHRLDHFTERRGPSIEVLDSAIPEAIGVEVTLHRVQLDHRVTDRRAVGERDPVAGVLLVQVVGLHEHVERPLAAARLDTGNPLHFRRRFEVLHSGRLVIEHVIHAQLVEHQAVVFLVLREQLLQLRLARCLLFLNRLDDVPAAPRLARLVRQQGVVLGNLLPQELLLELLRHPDPLKAGMRHDDRVPIPRGDLRGQVFPAVAGEVVLRGDEELGVRIPLLELAGELLE